MVEKHKALGRGLESLLPARPFSHVPPTLSPTPGDKGDAPATAATALRPGEAVLEIPLDQLDDNPYQTRSQLDDDALDELCDSILALGVIEPIIVRPAADGHYQVIAGVRRWKAAQMAGKDTVPAVVRQVSNQQAMEMTIVENLQREDLGIMDEARGYDRLSREFGLTQEQMAQRTGKDRSSVTNLLRLLKLPASVQVMLDNGRLSFGHAKVLMALESPEDVENLAHRIAVHSLSVRQTEQAVTNLVHPPETVEKVRIVDPNVKEAEQEL